MVLRPTHGRRIWGHHVEDERCMATGSEASAWRVNSAWPLARGGPLVSFMAWRRHSPLFVFSNSNRRSTGVMLIFDLWVIQDTPALLISNDPTNPRCDICNVSLARLQWPFRHVSPARHFCSSVRGLKKQVKKKNSASAESDFWPTRSSRLHSTTINKFVPAEYRFLDNREDFTSSIQFKLEKLGMFVN
jgi:hypothetical protein